MIQGRMAEAICWRMASGPDRQARPWRSSVSRRPIASRGFWFGVDRRHRALVAGVFMALQHVEGFGRRRDFAQDHPVRTQSGARS